MVFVDRQKRHFLAFLVVKGYTEFRKGKFQTYRYIFMNYKSNKARIPIFMSKLMDFLPFLFLPNWYLLDKNDVVISQKTTKTLPIITIIIVYNNSYVGKHLTPRGGRDFEGVGGI